MKSVKFTALLLAGLAMSTASFSQTGTEKLKSKPGKMKMKGKTVMVGGAAMYPTKTIVENAVNSADHTTLVAAVKAAGLVETLSGAGPYTVFAPTNAAFNLLPAGTVDNLVKPENKGTLTTVLTYHVVPGRLDTKDLGKMIADGNGSYEMTTAQGGKLWIMAKNGSLFLKDAQGGMARITISDVYQSNGVIHVIDHVLMP
jgi:uncharacterized surface protein with fasciclin (FAS1) repeats